LARPLAGITVLDLSRVLAGPYASQMLGDLGADVWKIERPGDGDETRGWGPPFVAGTSAYYLSLNRNKRSAALDFENAGHRAALARAASRADIVIENFLPGRLERFGLDPRTLRNRHPELVVCSITGYGQDGPFAMLPGYDAVLQGFVGLMSITGQEDGPPTKVGVAAVDVLTGVHAAAAILAALVGRLRQGTGAWLDVSLSEVGVASLVNVAEAALSTGRPWTRHGNAHPHIVPYQTFDTADEPVVIAVGNDGQWRKLCAALERNEWEQNESWSRNQDRILHREDVVAAVGGRLRERPREEWLTRLRAAGVPSGPVRELLEAVQDPTLVTRGMVRDVVQVNGDTVPMLGLPWRADGVRAHARRPPPALGQHTAEFLARFG
jgi:crotonobetainyl-CoA:carnitine CoA-transferase CaiB-like acyl-CoA transferase